MAERGKGLSRRQEQAIEALLTSPTVKRAAKRAGLSYRALKGYLQDPLFREEYRKARQQAREQALGLLAGAAAAAVGALRRNLKCGTAAVEVAAVAAGVTRYGDTAVTPGTMYSYRVRAVAAGLASAFSAVAAATTPPPAPDDTTPREVTGLVSIERRRPRIDRRGRYRQVVTVRNTGGDLIAGPLRLVLDGLPRGVRLLRRSGLTRTLVPGKPYVDLPASALDPGESVTLTLGFRNPRRRRLGYLPRLLAGVGSV